MNFVFGHLFTRSTNFTWQIWKQCYQSVCGGVSSDALNRFPFSVNRVMGLSLYESREKTCPSMYSESSILWQALQTNVEGKEGIQWNPQTTSCQAQAARRKKQVKSPVPVCGDAPVGLQEKAGRALARKTETTAISRSSCLSGQNLNQSFGTSA